MVSLTTCMLCGKDCKRSDNLHRHTRLCHSDKAEYVGHKDATGFTFSAIGGDFPHLFVGEKKSTTNTYVGYCVCCYKGFPAPSWCRSMDKAVKLIKEHTCAEKQVRTYTKVVKTEDANGNIVHKKEMQTGGVLITAEMILEYKERDEMKNMEVEVYEEAHNNPVHVRATIESAFKTASKYNSPKVQAKLKASVSDQPEPVPAPAPAPTPVQNGEIDWERVSKELCSHRKLKTYMPAQIQFELQRVEQTFKDSLTDADIEAEEMDWFDFMGTMVARSARYDALRKEKDTLLDKMDCKEGEFKRNTFKMQQELEAALKREAERDEEIRTLRAALYQREENNQMLRAALEKCKSQQVISHE
jgi:hypothetical protein